MRKASATNVSVFRSYFWKRSKSHSDLYLTYSFYLQICLSHFMQREDIILLQLISIMWLLLQLVTLARANGWRTVRDLFTLGLVVSNGFQVCGLAVWLNAETLSMRNSDGNLKLVKWKNLQDLNSWKGTSFSVLISILRVGYHQAVWLCM